jgi:putrescine aminotransferase
MDEQHVRQLTRADLAHLIHPQYNVQDHSDPVIFLKGKGALLTDVRGKQYIDGLACLWNVAVGHGRRELAEVAARQMREMAFSNAYTGYSNVPSIELAERLCSLAYPSMRAVFYANSGSEAIDGVLKVARFYWNLQGRPEKIKIIVRREAYHGGTFGATAATGMPSFHKGFGPLAEGFVRVGTCYCYRCEWGRDYPGCDLECAAAVEEAIEREGPDTVAAVLAEPVHGAGGIIPPVPEYWPRLRQICDRHNVLLIADEVITGFGRTGHWFALEHWGVQPDMMAVAKAITSAYIPLAAFIVSERIHEAIVSAPTDVRFMHGYTNAGHPTACAVALRNLRIIEEEGLVERAAAVGKRLLEGLGALRELPWVGNVRGLGLMGAVEVVEDKASRRPFEPSFSMGAKVVRQARERGLITRAKGDSVLLAPPLVVTPKQVDRAVEIVGESIRAAAEGR